MDAVHPQVILAGDQERGAWTMYALRLSGAKSSTSNRRRQWQCMAVFDQLVE